jgi:hypothetical protein
VKTLNPFPKNKKASSHYPVTYWSHHCEAQKNSNTPKWQSR